MFRVNRENTVVPNSLETLYRGMAFFLIGGNNFLRLRIPVSHACAILNIFKVELLWLEENTWKIAKIVP